MNSLRVIVTGAGSIVGQGIVKALHLSRLSPRVIATDVTPLSAALFRAHESYIMAPVEAPDALERIVELMRKIKADVLMIGSEFDLKFFARHKSLIEQETGAMIVVSPLDTIEMADDKLRTTEFLCRNGLAYAPAIAADSADAACAWVAKHGYPVILKTRRGTSARHVYVVKDEAELLRHLPTVPNPMLQELAGPLHTGLGGEFTCSVFRCTDGTLRGPFVSRRTLRGGSSWLVEVAPQSGIENLLCRLGQLIPSMGSLNVQLMLHEGRAIPFELNARFSGTTPIRAHFGFNEPEMALRNYLLGETLPLATIGHGMVIRYIEEIFLDNVAADELAEPFPRGHIHQWF